VGEYIMESVDKDSSVLKIKAAVELWKFVRRNNYIVEDDNYVPMAIYLSAKCKCNVGDKFVEYLIKEVIPYIASNEKVDSVDQNLLERKFSAEISNRRKMSITRRSYTVRPNFEKVINILIDPKNNVPDMEIIKALRHYSRFDSISNESTYQYLKKEWSEDYANQYVNMSDREVRFEKNIDDIKEESFAEATASEFDVVDQFLRLVDMYKTYQIKGEDFDRRITLIVSHLCGFGVSNKFIAHLLSKCYNLGIIEILRSNYFGGKSYQIVPKQYSGFSKDNMGELKADLIASYNGEFFDKSADKIYSYKSLSFFLELYSNYRYEGRFNKFPNVIENEFLYDKDTPIEHIRAVFYNNFGNFEISNKITEAISELRQSIFKAEIDSEAKEDTISPMMKRSQLLEALKNEYSEDKIQELRKIDKKYFSTYVNILAEGLNKLGYFDIRSYRSPENLIKEGVLKCTLNDNYPDNKAFSFMVKSYIQVNAYEEEDKISEAYVLSNGFTKVEHEGCFYPNYENLCIYGVVLYDTRKYNFMNVRLALMLEGAEIIDTNLREGNIEIICTLECYKSLVKSAEFGNVKIGFTKGFGYIGKSETEE
jgi:hypothetical protein